MDSNSHLAVAWFIDSHPSHNFRSTPFAVLFILYNINIKLNRWCLALYDYINSIPGCIEVLSFHLCEDIANPFNFRNSLCWWREIPYNNTHFLSKEIFISELRLQNIYPTIMNLD